MDFQDYNWKDVVDCHIKEGIIGSTFSMKTVRNYINMIDFIPKNQARKLYQFAQEKEENMREFRREKELEDKRAAAGGGVVVHTTPSLQNEGSKDENPIETLQNLKSLVDNKILTQEEFEIKKNEILSRI